MNNAKSHIRAFIENYCHDPESYDRAEKQLLEAIEKDGKESDGWVKVEDKLPEKKKDWNFSEQCLVYYNSTEHELGGYGISYYHYNPPYSKPMWFDFHRYGRQPDLWRPLPTPPTTI